MGPNAIDGDLHGQKTWTEPDRLGRIYPALARTLLAGRRIDPAAGLLWLSNSLETGAIASGAYDFRRGCF